MIRSLLLLCTIFLFSSCSLFLKTAQRTEIQITNSQLEELITSSVNDIIKEHWLSDFYTNSNERPILIASKISSPNHIILNKEKAYELFDFALLKSGQVRVVKSNEKHRILIPTELAKGESVDFVLTASIVEIAESKPSSYEFIVRLWNDNSLTEISEIRKLIQTNSTE
jgi:Holliday junction resolvase